MALTSINTMVGCNLRQKQLQQSGHLKKRCKLWSPTWQKEIGWIFKGQEGSEVQAFQRWMVLSIRLAPTIERFGLLD